MSRPRRALPLLILLVLLLLGGAVIAINAVLAPRDRAPNALRAPSVEPPGTAGGSGRRRRDRVRVGAGSGALQGRTGLQDGVTDAAGVDTGDDTVDDTVDDTGDAKENGTGSAVGAAPGEDRRETVRGRVADAATDDVLAGARILVVRRDHGWSGTRTRDDGTFEGQVPGDPGDGSLVELRVAAPGYETLIVPWTAGPVVARLQALDPTPLPGDVLGVATRADGRVVSGRLLLTTYDEMGDHHGLWVLADEAGAFRLEGLAAGFWQMRLVGGGADVDVVVPEGGVTRVNLVAGDGPWPGAMTAGEFERRRAELSSGLPPGVTDEELSDAQRAALAWQRILAIQDLEARRRGARPAREVLVTGLPEGGVAHLRAATTTGPNHSWRARVRGGEARLPALTPERWRLLLEVPGADDIAQTIDVEVGDGALTIAWSPAAAGVAMPVAADPAGE